MLQPLFIYSSYLPAATVTATDSASGYDPADVLQAEEDNVWKPANTSGEKSLVLDFSVAQDIGCVAVVGDYLNGVTMEVRGSTDNFVASDDQLVAPFIIAEYTTAWAEWVNASYRYAKLIFSGFGTSFTIAHAAFCKKNLLPFMNDGADLDCFQTEGVQLISPDGRFLGSNRLRTMRTLSLDFGQVMPDEYIIFQAWAEQCVKNMQPFFFVPDTEQPLCHFGWTDPKYKFSAPQKNGMHNIAKIPFNSRVA